MVWPQDAAALHGVQRSSRYSHAIPFLHQTCTSVPESAITQVAGQQSYDSGLQAKTAKLKQAARRPPAHPVWHIIRF